MRDPCEHIVGSIGLFSPGRIFGTIAIGETCVREYVMFFMENFERMAKLGSASKTPLLHVYQYSYPILKDVLKIPSGNCGSASYYTLIQAIFTTKSPVGHNICTSHL